MCIRDRVDVVLDDGDAVLFGIGGAFPDLTFDGFFALVVTCLLYTSLDGSSIVAAALGEAGQAGSGTDVLILNVDADGVDALGVVSAGGSTDDAEDIVLGSVDPQAHVIGKDKGADVQGSTVGMGHPVTVHVHQRLNGLNVVLHGDLRCV